MLISESGDSRQIDLTPMRIRAAIAGIVGVVVLAVALGVGLGFFLDTGKQGLAGVPDLELRAKVESLQEALKSRELEISAKDQQLAELADSLESAKAMASRGPAEFTGPAESPGADQGGDNDLSGPNYAGEPGPTVEPEPPSNHAQPSESVENNKEKDHRVASSQNASTSAAPSKPLLNFKARDLTAIRESANEAKLSFRLEKDRPDVFFEGYLFVYVETPDPKGGYKWKVYPQKAKLGDGDFPLDYKAGHFVEFKKNSEVHLDDVPLNKHKRDASLRRVVVLLYSVDGGIVFQREFNRREINNVSRTSSTARDALGGAPRRRAL